MRFSVMMLFCILLGTGAVPLAADTLISRGRLRGQRSEEQVFAAVADGTIRVRIQSSDGTVLHQWEVEGRRIRTAACRDINNNAYEELLLVVDTAPYLAVFVVVFNPDAERFTVLTVNETYRERILHYSLVRGPWGGQEIRIIRRIDTPTVFSEIQPINNRQPYLTQDVRIRLGTDRELSAVARIEETPLFVLHSFLRALQQEDNFAAYRYWARAEELDVFITAMKPYKMRTSQFILKNWHLQLHRHERSRGWMTFAHTPPGQAGMLYQVFFKKDNAEWKIISIRAAKEYTS